MMKKKLVIILPGPIRRIEDMFKYKELSNFFSGDIISSANRKEILKAKSIGSFALHTTRHSHSFSFLYNINFFFYCLTFALKARVYGHKYDLVITYDPLKTGMFGAAMAKILGAKFAPEVNGVYTSPAEYIDEENKISTKIKKLLFPVVEANVIKWADGIKLLFPTQLEPFEHLTGQKIVHSFFNLVPIERFTNQNIKEEKVILFVGFPFKRKGVDILIKAFKQISKKHPEWKLKILGWYPDKEKLMTHIDGHPNITYHPPVSTTEIANHICACSIFVLPSRSEAMGRVLIESMAAGKPRIGANVDGIPTVISDEVDGLLFRSEDVQDLAEKLELLIGNPEMRKKMGQAGRERVKHDFSKEKYFEKLIRFYNEVLGQP